jgi:hypothetical protein
MREFLMVKATWLRGIFMLIFFAIVYYFIILLIAAIALFQFGSVLFTGKLNVWLLDFGRSLSTYSQQIVSFLTYNSEQKPFPFSNWPPP